MAYSKIIGLLCIMLSVLCISCKEYDDTSISGNNTTTKIVVYPDDMSYRYIIDATSFEFNGHKYYDFRAGHYGRSVVHDPDCPCHHNIDSIQ